MLSVSDLKNGTEFIHEKTPYAVLEVTHKHIGRGGSVTTVRMKNLFTGGVTTQNFRTSDKFEEADLTHLTIIYLYNHRDAYWFAKQNDPKERFQLSKETIGENVAQYLKPNMPVEAIEFQGTIVNIALPIKMDFVVKEAPPGIKGNTAQGGTKPVVLETGATVNVPLFVGEGDIITVNTELGEYVSRVQKGK
ncbi:elongation factor P [Candidatus Azambacteria bacterium]|nr:elongation factor P [Candidatus Azambacteria bacterium]